MKKLITLVFILVLTFSFSTAVFADQAAYITEKEAKKAAEFLKKKGEIRHHCQPCNDKSVRFEKINTIEAVHTGYQNYWQVKVNGKGIDLAYVYYKKKNDKWKNAAMRFDLKVSDVPRFLANH